MGEDTLFAHEVSSVCECECAVCVEGRRQEGEGGEGQVGLITLHRVRVTAAT